MPGCASRTCRPLTVQVNALEGEFPGLVRVLALPAAAPGVHGQPELPRFDPVDHIRIVLERGRIVVPCQFRGTLRPCGRIACIAAVQRACGTLAEPGRNAVAGEQAAGEASAGQWPRSVCMDGCL